jgi:hypothetical protein
MHTVLTRRTALLGLGGAALLPHPAHADLTELTAAARKEGLLTCYVAQMSGEAAEDMGRIFTRQYPGISVSVVRTTGQAAYQRVQQELKNSAPQCDVFSTTDIAHMPALHARGALPNYVPRMPRNSPRRSSAWVRRATTTPRPRRYRSWCGKPTPSRRPRCRATGST